MSMHFESVACIRIVRGGGGGETGSGFMLLAQRFILLVKNEHTTNV